MKTEVETKTESEPNRSVRKRPETLLGCVHYDPDKGVGFERHDESVATSYLEFLAALTVVSNDSNGHNIRRVVQVERVHKILKSISRVLLAEVDVKHHRKAVLQTLYRESGRRVSDGDQVYFWTD